MQCVEHKVEFNMEKDKNGGDADDCRYVVNARDFFIPTQVISFNWHLGFIL